MMISVTEQVLGPILSKGPRYEAKITTNKRLGTGTRSSIMVHLIDSEGNVAEGTCVENLHRRDHKRGEASMHYLNPKGLEKPEEIVGITLMREIDYWTMDEHWFLNMIEVYFIQLFTTFGIFRNIFYKFLDFRDKLAMFLWLPLPL